MSTNQVLRDGLVDYLPQIRRVVGKVARYEDVIDDVSQEVCVRVIEKEKLWSQQESKLNSWLNSITRNLTINYLSKKKEKTLEGREDCFPHPEVEKFSEEQIEWIITLFQTLSQKQQQILNMKYYQGMTVTQIGKELSITHQAVSQHITLALKVLRKKAKTYGLLAVLFPWNWVRSLNMQMIIVSKLKLGVILFSLTLLGFLGYGFLGSDFGSVNEKSKGMDLDFPISVKVADKMPKQKKLDQDDEKIESIASRDRVISEVFSDTDFEKTLKWLKGLSSHRFAKMTLESLKNIKELNLSELKINDYDLKHIRGLTSLSTLDLSDTEITDVGLKQLSSLTALIKLNLGDTDVTDAGLKELSSLISLEELLLYRAYIKDEGLKDLVSLKSLTKLYLVSSRITDAGLKALQVSTSLAELKVYSREITDAGLKELSLMTSLTKLTVGGSKKITHAGLQKLSALPSLTELDLSEGSVTDEDLKGLSHMTSLTKLNLRLAEEVTDKGLKYLASLTSLIELNLEYTQVTGAGLKELAVLPSLTKLSLSHSKVTEYGLKYLKYLPSLTELNYSFDKLSVKGLQKLAVLPSLKKLGLAAYDETWSDQMMEELSNMPSLTELNLTHMTITKEILKKLKETLPNCKISTWLVN